jgi:ABC-2 type transport system ATP-binding protein
MKRITHSPKVDEMKPAIKIQDLTKHFKEITAVDHVSLEVEVGEIFGFLGPNGAGKTTTIRMLTGILQPDSGTASIMGFDIRQQPIQCKQLISVVPEMANAYIDLTAWQNLLFMSELYGIPNQIAVTRAESLLKRFELFSRRHQKVRGYSKGMRQMLILCMALTTSPKVLFLDEPAVGLDVKSARLIREIIQELREQDITVFLTTHNMEEANQLCDRIAIINHGKLAAIDNPESLRLKSSELMTVEVRFDKPVPLNSLPPLRDSNELQRAGDKIRIYTNKPHSIIDQITNYTRTNNLNIVSLNTLAPSLEDVYMKLIATKEGE